MRACGDHGEYSLVRMTDSDRGFYAAVGPIAMRPDVVRALEGAVTTSALHVWWVARTAGVVVAISSCRDTGRDAWRFEQTWVEPDHRRRGLYRAIFRLKEAFCWEQGAAVLKGSALPQSAPVFDRQGWVVTSRRGPRWTWHEKRRDG